MRRLPTLDDQEHGHTDGSAYAAGDVDALDALTAIDYEAAVRLRDGLLEKWPYLRDAR